MKTSFHLIAVFALLFFGLAVFPFGATAPSHTGDAAAAVEEVKAFRAIESRRVFERLDAARRAEAAAYSLRSILTSSITTSPSR